VRRLALFSGGELTGPDRRKVERHLLICRDCRQRQAALAGALDLLHVAAAETPAAAEEARGSLWPALERQIREERHAPRPAVPIRERLADLLAAWIRIPVRPRWRLVALLGSLLVVLGLTGVGVEFWAEHRVAELLKVARQPIVPGAAAELEAPVILEPVPGPSIVWQAGPAEAAPSAGASPPAEVGYDYDLEAGTPMGPDTRSRQPGAY
jgi:hypothetical protein